MGCDVGVVWSGFGFTTEICALTLCCSASVFVLDVEPDVLCVL